MSTTHVMTYGNIILYLHLIGNGCFTFFIVDVSLDKNLRPKHARAQLCKENKTTHPKNEKVKYDAYCYCKYVLKES